MKRVLLYILAIFWLWFWFFCNFSHAAWRNIVKDARFTNLVDNLSKTDNVIYDPKSLKIDPWSSIVDSIRTIFYPDLLWDGWIIYDYIRNIWVGILVLFLILNGIYMIWYADTEKELEKTKLNFLYIWFGSFLVFGGAWLLSFLKLGSNIGWIVDLTSRVQESILFQILSFFKAAAFFAAIVLIVYHGVQIIRSYEKEDKLKEAKIWIINVLSALIFIKIIDYIFYIATQENFKSQAIALIVAISKALWRLIWGLSIFYLIYAWFELITSSGDEAKYKNAINTLRSILVVGITIMLFLLITYQLFTDVFK